MGVNARSGYRQATRRDVTDGGWECHRTYARMHAWSYPAGCKDEAEP